MGLSDRMAAFWASECGARGPALIHTHGDCADPERRRHEQCPCEECGLTPERWAMMTSPNVVRLVPPEASQIPHPDDEPLQLPQPGEMLDGAPVERQGTWPARVNKHKQWSPALRDYVDGDPKGPGRGELSPAWVEWALSYRWGTWSR